MQTKKEAGLITQHTPKNWVKVPVLKPLRKIIYGNHTLLKALNTKAQGEMLFNLIRQENEENDNSHSALHFINTYETFKHWLKSNLICHKTYFYTFFDLRSQAPFGFLSFKNLALQDSLAQATQAYFSPLYYKSKTLTETIYLLMNHLFEELGYLNFEWSFNNLDKVSRLEIERLGFRVKQNACPNDSLTNPIEKMVYTLNKTEWFLLKDKYLKWLDPTNFDHKGKQIFTLLEI